MPLFRPRILHRRPGLHGPIEVSESAGVRCLHLGSRIVQSAMRIRDPWGLELHYTRAMMGFLLFRPAPAKVVMVGLGGGSLAKFAYRRLPEAQLTVVEIDPEVVGVARAYFQLPDDDDRLQVVVADAVPWIAEHPGGADALLVDAFGSDTAPEQLLAEDFFASVLGALLPGGVAAFNLWASEPAFALRLQRLERVFDHQVLCLPAERPGNVIAFAFRGYPGPISWEHLRRRACELQGRYNLEFASFVRRLADMNPHDARQLFL